MDYSGILSCFFQGFSTVLLRSMLKARQMRRRVVLGRITSSMEPRSAAMNGLAKRSPPHDNAAPSHLRWQLAIRPASQRPQPRDDLLARNIGRIDVSGIDHEILALRVPGCTRVGVGLPALIHAVAGAHHP